MRAAGLDIGSRTIKLAVIEGGGLISSRKSLTSHNPLDTAAALIDGTVFDVLTASSVRRRHAPLFV